MKSILFVDDEPKILKGLERSFSLLDVEYTLLFAEGAVSALKLLESAPKPDLIVCDVRMPEMSGYEFLKTLRNNPRYATIPFIFLTGQDDIGDLRAAMVAGADDYLLKPFRIEALHAAIEARLRRGEQVEVLLRTRLDELKTSILNSFPHEFYSPLVVIQGFSEIIQGMFEESNDKDGQQMCSRMIRATERLKHNFGNFIELANGVVASEKRKKNDSIAVYAHKAIVAVTLQALGKRNRQQDAVWKLDEGILSVKQKDFDKVLFEILDNAGKFSSEGSEILIRGENRGDLYFVSVENEGYGFRTQDVQKVQAFMQFQRPKYEQQGFGLGLAVVEKILREYEQTLSIRSTPNERTVVTVSFPLETSLVEPPLLETTLMQELN